MFVWHLPSFYKLTRWSAHNGNPHSLHSSPSSTWEELFHFILIHPRPGLVSNKTISCLVNLIDVPLADKNAKSCCWLLKLVGVEESVGFSFVTAFWSLCQHHTSKKWFAFEWNWKAFNVSKPFFTVIATNQSNQSYLKQKQLTSARHSRQRSWSLWFGPQTRALYHLCK